MTPPLAQPPRKMCFCFFRGFGAGLGAPWGPPGAWGDPGEPGSPGDSRAPPAPPWGGGIGWGVAGLHIALALAGGAPCWIEVFDGRRRLSQMVAGLHYLHSHRVLHRDQAGPQADQPSEQRSHWRGPGLAEISNRSFLRE